jgi:hypothetical protein
MYCNNKKIDFRIKPFGDYDTIFINTDRITELDNTKDFDNQTQETYRAIFDALISIK